MQNLKQGSRILAVAVGGRGIADISLITASVVKALKQAGLEPFIVSGMASHGQGQPLIQAQLLAELGVAEGRGRLPDPGQCGGRDRRH